MTHRGAKAGEPELRQAIRIDSATRSLYEKAGWWANDTLTRWLADDVSRAADRPAAKLGDTVVSYRELVERAERFARGLHDLGVRRGDVVSVQLPNTPEFLIAYFAITRLGAVLSTVHMPYRTAEIRTLLGHNGCVAFIGYGALKDFAPAREVLGLKGQLPALAHVISVGEKVSGAVAFDDLLRSDRTLPADVAADPADPFLLLFTSGTSASPKAVPLTYQMTLGNARLGAGEHQFRDGDSVLSVAPFTHLLGLYALHLTTRVAGTSLLLPVFTPPELASAIARHRPSVLVCAPAHLAALVAAGLLDQADLSCIRLIITAGSALSPDLASVIAARLPNGFLTNLWGMTELQAGLYTRPGDSPEIASTTCGRAAPGAEVRIADLDDQPVAPGEEGELQIRGALLFRGYYNNDLANRQAFTADGWFRSGDLAVIDAAGNVRITGRKTDVINRGGIKYNPLDVEIILGSHPKVMQVAVVAYPDPVLGQRACCFVVPAEGPPPTLDELCGHLLTHGVSKVKLPERLLLIDEMPMTPTRKIMKRRLYERLTETRENAS